MLRNTFKSIVILICITGINIGTRTFHHCRENYYYTEILLYSVEGTTVFEEYNYKFTLFIRLLNLTKTPTN